MTAALETPLLPVIGQEGQGLAAAPLRTTLPLEPMRLVEATGCAMVYVLPPAVIVPLPPSTAVR